MGEPIVNGEKPSSQFLHHLSTLPVGSDSLTYLKNHPYGQKSLQLADQGESKDRFPIVKKDTETIKGALKGYIHMPFRVVEEGKKHVLQVYSAEYKNCGGGEGYVAAGKAVITTGLTITSESLEWLRACITRAEQKGREGVEAVSEKKASKK
ncbi:predicted protein [Histoplasma mississippiense (nom. inval.)]|uniref:predicted protein n=1 Tax=Ajellomyces capsulatus (strain NAm1 / WU24) TaxID=2059318 RepID=UPI000157C84D|nr:predicted protein [Histoplasma mississippiense (nom. inval.)]EDN09395.1 predicted protein [Histoplasma mississippiense (nom. inval.)]